MLQSKVVHLNEESSDVINSQLQASTSQVIHIESHSKLITAIIETYAPRFLQSSALVYVCANSNKSAFHDDILIKDLNISTEEPNKLPDVIFYLSEKNWLVLVDSITGQGSIDKQRHKELADLFNDAKAGIVYVTAFPDCANMAKHSFDIDWETDVWIADCPEHMIHFNGLRFLGPYTINA